MNASTLRYNTDATDSISNFQSNLQDTRGLQNAQVGGQLSRVVRQVVHRRVGRGQGDRELQQNINKLFEG